MAQVQAIDTRPIPGGRWAEPATSAWVGLYRTAGVAAFTIVALVPIQAAIFLLWPPPNTVVEYFSTFQRNALLGLLDLDLLLIIDQLLLVPVLLGLYVALRKTDASVILLGTTLGLFGALLFVVSREATFSMLWLSQQYAAVTSEAERSTCRAPLVHASAMRR